MTYRNTRILFVLVVVCAFCYGNAARYRDLGDLALAMRIIEQEYVEAPNKDKLYQAAMKGMVESLDPYSGYIPIESFKPFQAMFEQEFGGLGVSLDGPPRRGRLTVVSTVFDSPAYRSGVKPGDVILEIDGVDAEKSAVEGVSKKLRGKEGTSVKLKLERYGQEEPVLVDIVRGRIDVESVLGDRRKMDGTWEYRMKADKRIAYMRIEIFGEKTTEEVRKALQKANSECKAVIIDLRDNTGGLLNAATDICDMFLDDGEMVSTRGRGDRIDHLYVAKPGTEVSNNIPVVVMVNGHSASASEVVAACLQDRHRAVVVGERSYGKGSVQNVIPLDAGMAAMRLTTAYYYPPSGRLIHRKPNAKPEDCWGVLPDSDCEVKLDEDQFTAMVERFRNRANPMENGIEESNNADEDSTLEDDLQLKRAVEVLQAKLDAASAKRP